MAKHVYGVDFGTSNIKVYDAITGKLLNEKNLIAVKGKDEVYSSGDEAFEMYEKAPSYIHITFPIQYGVVADMVNMTRLFECFFEEVNLPKKRKNGDFCLAVPTDISEVEKRAFYDLVADSRIKAKDIVVIEKPVADAVGLGINIDSPKGNMIINIGADTTEITVTSLGGIVVSKIIKLGGNRLDEAICNMIKKKYNILIGMKTAEMVKIALANAMPDDATDLTSIKVFGRNIITGLPAEKQVTADLVNAAILDILKQIVDSVKSLLERTPPDLSADIVDNGLYLTGGSSQIPGIDELIAKSTGMKVNLAAEPQLSVINGIARVLANPDLRDLLYTPREEDDYE